MRHHTVWQQKKLAINNPTLSCSPKKKSRRKRQAPEPLLLQISPEDEQTINIYNLIDQIPRTTTPVLTHFFKFLIPDLFQNEKIHKEPLWPRACNRPGPFSGPMAILLYPTPLYHFAPEPQPDQHFMGRERRPGPRSSCSRPTSVSPTNGSLGSIPGRTPLGPGFVQSQLPHDPLLLIWPHQASSLGPVTAPQGGSTSGPFGFFRGKKIKCLSKKLNPYFWVTRDLPPPSKGGIPTARPPIQGLEKKLWPNFRGATPTQGQVCFPITKYTGAKIGSIF